MRTYMRTYEINKKWSIAPQRALDGRGMPHQYSKFLNTLPWTHFGTFTTKEQLTLDASRRLVDKIASKLPTPKEKLGCKLFWVAEQFKSGDGYHFHILLNCVGSAHIKHLKDWYEGSYGFCKILNVNGRAASYMTKYLGRPLTDYGIV
jgi:hypothetical protein